MLAIESATHSSLTTDLHRWPIYRRRGNQRNRHRELAWTTSGEGFGWGDHIITSAPRADFPTDAKWADDFVELVAWFWTEGHISPTKGVTIYQSHAVNSAYCTRIRAAMLGTYGPAAIGRMPARSGVGPMWREEERQDGKTVWHLNQAAAAPLLMVAPGRVVEPSFLLSLTKAQLDLFIATSIAGDGTVSPLRGRRTLAQKSKSAIDSFQMACTLAGIATTNTPTRNGPMVMHLVALLHRTTMTPRATTSDRRHQRAFMRWVDHDGPVWCVTTGLGTWLARRRGTVYFTGNCAPLGIPYTRFLGRVGPPAWTEEDQDYALAWQAEKARVCSRCGSRPEDWPVDDKGRLLPDPPLEPHHVECVGCDVLDSYDEEQRHTNDGKLPAGYQHYLRPYVEPDDD